MFSQASEDLWKGIGAFDGRSSLRTWFYTIARHAASRSRRSPHRRPGRHEPLSAASDVAERIRSQTVPHLRTEAKDKLAAIREALDPEDRALLVLRIDRAMDWNDVARVLDPDGSTSAEALSRTTARLRKRFERVKEEIRVRAIATGLISAD